MSKLFVIGIGAGDPEHVTVQAIKALNQADVLFVIDKGPEKQDLVRLRREICERYIESDSYRVVEIPDPERDRGSPSYRAAVEEWRARRAEEWERAIRAELGEGECGAFLVWGDPSLYDGTLGIVARTALELEVEVVPGISSVQALAARHRVPLNDIGGSIKITTGRRLAAEGLPADGANVVVMLDAGCAFKGLAGGELDIHWGAYIGTDDELLVAGPLGEVGDEIERLRAEARRSKGWIMDTYLLRRRRPA